MTIVAGTSRGLFAIDQNQVNQTDETVRGVRDIQLIDGVLYAGTRHGLMRSTDGYSWEASGLQDLEVWQIRRGEDAEGQAVLYASTQPAGLWRSCDGGHSWTATDSFTEHPEAEHWCVPIEPPLPGQARALVTHQNHLWVGVEVGGIMRSSDAGASWQLTLPGDNPDIHMLFAHPDKPDTLFVSTGYGRLDGIADMVEGNAGVFRSDDGGVSWQYIWHGITPRYSRPMCIDLRAPYAVTVAAAPTAFSHYKQDGGAGACLFQTVDEGKSWTNLGDAAHNPSPANFHALTTDKDNANAVLTGTDSGEVWQVNDNKEWHLMAKGLPAVTALLAI